ncbi:uncharacterized protein OCT59_014432 [Rhizophagus irregularis]|uniref:Uncharacterized protein n=1 Tax=Rhizophagus irregularis (strain DAOM 181602 / DAOM 197198 / MUCL 43194) TaxID=747089 RepID=A0A2H5TPZ5_RHIID|nr:hypothetical protein GLOIN_2v1785218 [Rhizophagus irregularis DAOM 181602=DAOM 197198]POG62499.1 hypothetical protein GLOIN_2v1785218 [Rhizophagus irregularis DAOM 181602=DAOM 197198]UZO22060.1 hypothetical protein OCT59_014432 [Rhizophagus irregularis]GBC44525.1 hypothetical protein GLOIN_2v1785218 [Rhizophagus irregularis DAOM 181602=DAOM 197198]CAG8615131.1 22106_t:CDS:1 [Rhizophagus irregularis]|eukprot:XP_025169365.1 hypothetical protein GLOIN_2v1785218 [Rhizophagus irregularis DAOM 181602=DAOM 197198]
MDNNYNNLNFIDDGDLRPQTTDSQTNVYDNNNDCPMMTNTSANATASSHSYPITSSDSPRPLPQQQIQQPVYQQNIENNIQQPFSNITQPIPQNVPHYIQNNYLPFNPPQINHSGIIPLEFPGIKIIIIPTFPPMTNSSQINHPGIFTIDIPGSKVIIITL